MLVQTYMRRVRAVINPHTGRLNMQRWHICDGGRIGWHGIPWPEHRGGTA